MNIAEAKQELKDTVRTYLAKDENGYYRIPRVRQRPILLMGPPGIGKTAIMEQVAKECQIGLVAYTMTHHTRQSAIGLPMIEHQNFGGQEYTVTEYTMSEIIASVYKLMEKTGCREGILFLDEINCVSETLAPVMLQFLQNKAFGGHALPEGWIIAAAGNPKEYNKAARDFDIATLDRVRRMNVLPELEAWKKYAWASGIHGSILSYLNCRPDSFYYIHQTAEGMEFVTARGWEDLSVMLQEHERQGLPVTEGFMKEYLYCSEISEDFFAFYQMIREYRKQCPVDKILKGDLTEEERNRLQTRLEGAPKDETFSVSGWLLTGVLYELDRAERTHRSIQRLEEMIENFRRYTGTDPQKKVVNLLGDYIEKSIGALTVKEENGLIQEREIREEQEGIRSLRRSFSSCKGRQLEKEEDVYEVLGEEVSEKRETWLENQKKAAGYIRNAVRFLMETFGEGEELLSFMAGLSGHSEMKEFVGWEELQEYEDALIWLEVDSREKQIEQMFLCSNCKTGDGMIK